MSRRSTLGRLLAAKRLFERPTEYAGFDTGRIMYVTPEILAITRPPFADTVEGERLAELAQMLDAFSELSRFSVAEDPDHKPPDAMLSRVRPVGADFWSIRVTDPEDEPDSRTPGIRALGAFIDKDEFLALNWHMRECMSFDDDVAEVQLSWRDYFGSDDPYSGGSLDDYLTHFWRV